MLIKTKSVILALTICFLSVFGIGAVNCGAEAPDKYTQSEAVTVNDIFVAPDGNDERDGAGRLESRHPRGDLLRVQRLDARGFDHARL